MGISASAAHMKINAFWKSAHAFVKIVANSFFIEELYLAPVATYFDCRGVGSVAVCRWEWRVKGVRGGGNTG